MDSERPFFDWAVINGPYNSIFVQANGIGPPFEPNNKMLRRSNHIMSAITFEIKRIALDLDFCSTATWGCMHIRIQGYVNCYGENGNQLIIYGLHPSSPVPSAPVCIMPSAVAALFVPYEELKIYATHLQKEQQVFACLDADHPERMGLITQQSGFVHIAC